MPRRLLLAADILRDVASTVNEVDRPLLEAAAAELTERAVEISAKQGLSLDLSPQMDALRPTIRRLAAALDPEVDHAHPVPVH